MKKLALYTFIFLISTLLVSASSFVDRSTGKTPTCDSELGGLECVNGNDGDNTTIWHATEPGPDPDFIYIDLEDNYSIEIMEIHGLSDRSGDFEIWASFNATTWEKTDTFKSYTFSGAPENFTIENVTTGRYWRFNFSNEDSAQGFALREIIFWDINTTIDFIGLTNNATNLTTTGDVVLWNVTINVSLPSVSLDTCWFQHNDSGSFVNFSVQSCSAPFVFPANITLAAASQQLVCGQYGSNDTDGDTTTSELSCLTLRDFINPTFENFTNNASNEVVEETVNWSVILLDDVGLANYTFGSNETGSFVNQSVVSISSTSFNASAVITVLNTVNTFVCGQFYFEDGDGNGNATDRLCLTTPNLFQLNVSIQNTITNDTLSGFNVTAYDSMNASNIVSTETDDTFAFLSLRPSNYTVVGKPQGFSNTSDNISFSNNQNLTLFAINESTIFIRFVFNELTRIPITENYTIEVIGDFFAQNFSSDTNLTISALPTDNYTIRYSAPSFDTRLYFVEISPQSSEDILLFLLPSENSSTVNVNVKDLGFSNLEGARVLALRYYLSENAFETVEMVETDFEGNGQLHLQQDAEFYKFIIIFDGQTRFESIGTLITSSIVTLGINFQIDITENLLGTLDNLIEASASLNYNNNTGTFTFTYADSSGSVQEGCLEVRKITNIGFETVSEQCVESTAAVIIHTINITEDGTHIATAVLNTQANTNSTRILVGTVTVTISGAVNVFGQYGVFLSVIFVGVIAMVGAFAGPVAMVVMVVFGLIIISILQIAVLPWSGLAALIVMAVVIGYKVKTLQQ